MNQRSRSTIDESEVVNFAQLSEEWWNENGKLKLLHRMNYVRIPYIKACVEQFLGSHISNSIVNKPFKGLKILDVGCGGGILSLPICRLGGDVTGIDATESAILAAKHHASGASIDVNYIHTTAEDLSKQGYQYDVVLCMEIIEHVADVQLFLESCMSLLKPSGLLFISTINRTFKSYILALIGAEYLLRFVPLHTHEWNKFLKPSEIFNIINRVNPAAKLQDLTGLSYNIINSSWKLCDSLDINYMMCLSL